MPRRPRLPQPEDIPRIVVTPGETFYHGSTRRIRRAGPCSYFSKTRGQASGVIYGPYARPAAAKYVLSAQVREPTVFLDITGDNPRSLSGGDFRFVQIMMAYLVDVDEGAGTSEADYGRAFCENRHIFPDCAGLYRERYGLLVAEPDEVMHYGRLLPAAKKGHYWPGGPRTNPGFLKRR
jgi:hypothetical protein